MSNKVRTTLIFIVVLVWAANFAAPLWIRDFKPPEALNAIFMVVVGYLVNGYKDNNGNNNRDRNEERERDGLGDRNRVDLRRRSDRGGDPARESDAEDE